MKPLKKPPLVEVHWVDARDINESGIKHEDAMKYGLIERTHSGYLVSADDQIVRLAPGLDEDGYDNLIILPAGWVRSITYRARKPKVKRADAPKAE